MVAYTPPDTDQWLSTRPSFLLSTIRHKYSIHPIANTIPPIIATITLTTSSDVHTWDDF
jgi:hypothetical protein